MVNKDNETKMCIYNLLKLWYLPKYFYLEKTSPSNKHSFDFVSWQFFFYNPPDLFFITKKDDKQIICSLNRKKRWNIVAPTKLTL